LPGSGGAAPEAGRANQSAGKCCLSHREFPRRLFEPVSPNLKRFITRQLYGPSPPDTVLPSAQSHKVVTMVSIRLVRAPFHRRSQLIPHPVVFRQLLLQASPSIERPTTSATNSKANTTHYSALFRKNYAMLAAVFTAGFAFEVYAPPRDVGM
jgi:hypothetical protein